MPTAPVVAASGTKFGRATNSRCFRNQAWSRLPTESLAEKDLQALKAMIDDPALRKLPENRGGLIRGESETFHAEMWAAPASDSAIDDLTPSSPGGYLASSATRHIRWQNADGQNPLPAAVEKMVDWLKNFNTKDGSPFEYTELEQVCPSQGLSYVRPSVAENSLPQ